MKVNDSNLMDSLRAMRDDKEGDERYFFHILEMQGNTNRDISHKAYTLGLVIDIKDVTNYVKEIILKYDI